MCACAAAFFVLIECLICVSVRYLLNIFATVISKKAKYALIALVHLAEKYDEGPVLISTIAEEEALPQKFLEAILLTLKNAGILNSKKGKGGGYYLRHHPKDVNMAQILRVFDGAIALLPCVSEKFYERCDECKVEEQCSIREAFQKVRDESVLIFQKYSIQSLVDRKSMLRQIL